MMSHYQKGQVAPHFDHLALRSTVVLLRIPLASHEADVSVSSVKQLKKSYCIFILLIF